MHITNRLRHREKASGYQEGEGRGEREGWYMRVRHKPKL